MKSFERSWNSRRLKIVDLICAQGGHHSAPQYRYSGLSAALAAANAGSISLASQSSPAGGWCSARVGGLADGTLAGVAGAGALRPHDASRTARTAIDARRREQVQRVLMSPACRCAAESGLQKDTCRVGPWQKLLPATERVEAALPRRRRHTNVGVTV